MFTRFLTTVAALLLFTSANAQVIPPEIIDFEGLLLGQRIDDEFLVSLGVTVTAENLSSGPDAAVIFDTNNPTGGDNDLGAPFAPSTSNLTGVGSVSPGNILILHENNNCNSETCLNPDDEASRPAGVITFYFETPSLLESLDVFDVQYDNSEANPDNQIFIYGAAGLLSDSFHLPNTGDNQWDRLEFGIANVTRLELHLDGSGAFDNLQFTPNGLFNEDPEFTSEPILTTIAGSNYSYQLVAADPENDDLNYSLSEAPIGASVDPASGLIGWLPSSQDVGINAIHAVATDSEGNEANQVFALVVRPDTYVDVIDFEGFGLGQIIDDEYASTKGVSLSTQNVGGGPDVAIIFDTNNPTGGDNDLGAPFQEGDNNTLGEGPLSPGNVLIIHETNNCDASSDFCANPDDEAGSPAGTITINFLGPVFLETLDVFDEQASPSFRNQLRLTLEDGSIIDDFYLPLTGDGKWDRLAINAVGVTQLEIGFDSSSAIDNIVFSPLDFFNRVPVINSNPLAQGAVGQLYNYDVDASDPDGDTLVYSLAAAPSGMTIDSVSGLISWTPSLSDLGVTLVSVEVMDTSGALAQQDFSISVFPNATIQTLGFEEFALGQIIDDEYATSLGVTISTVNLRSGPDAAVVFDTNNPTGGDTDLAAPFTVSAGNTTGEGSKSPGNILVIHENNTCDSAFEFCANPDDTAGNPAGRITLHFAAPVYLVSVDVFDVDHDGSRDYHVSLFDTNDQLLSDTLELPLTGDQMWDRLTINTANVARAELTFAGSGGIDSIVFTGMGASNQSPTITSTAIMTANVGELYNYQLVAADPENDTLTYSLSQAPTGMTIDPATGLVSWTPSLSQKGDNDVTILVSDGNGGQAIQDFVIDVIELNANPIITSTELTDAVYSELYSYQLIATDSNNDNLLYSLTQAPAGMTIDEVSGLVEWTPSLNQVGDSDVSILVADNNGGQAAQSFVITVLNLNTDPIITSQAPLSAIVNSVYSYSVIASDVENDTLEYSLTLAPDGMTVDSATGVISWIPGVAQAGDSAVTIEVNDGNGGVANQSFTIATASLVNTQPTISSQALNSVFENAQYQYSVIANDAEGDILSYGLDVAPDGMTIDSTTGEINWLADPFFTGSVATNNNQCFMPNPSFIDSVDLGELIEDPATGISLPQGYEIEVFATNTSDQQGPVSLSFDSAGNLYLALGDSGASMILAGTNTPIPFGDTAPNDSDGVAVDSQGNIIINGSPITKYAPDGSVIWERTCGGQQRLTVDEYDNIYAGGHGTHVCKIAPDNSSVVLFDGFSDPSEVLIGPDGFLYVGELNGRFSRVDTSTGEILASINLDYIPESPVLDSSGNLIFLAGTAATGPDPSIQIIDFESNTTGVFARGFERAFAFAYAPDGDLYLGDGAKKIIYRVSRPEFVAGEGRLQPDLRVGDITFAEDSESLSVEIVNRGLFATNEITELMVYGGIPSAATFLFSTPIGELQPGETQILITLPPAITEALLIDNITVTINEAESFEECSFDNNQNTAVLVKARVADPGGLFATQTFLLNVQDVNEPPVIDSQIVDLVTAGDVYSYQVGIADADRGDAPTFSLLNSPSGMGINSVTGLIEWLPDSTQVGNFQISVLVTDLRGAETLQNFSVKVNTVPIISSTPPATAIQGELFLYEVMASDLDGDVPSFSLSVAPAGMSIDAVTGLVSWIPDATQSDSVTVAVVASDVSGGMSVQEFDLPVRVVSEEQRPFSHEGREFWLAPTFNNYSTTSELRIQLSSVDAAAVVNIELPKLGINTALSIPAGQTLTHIIDATTFSQLIGLPYGNDVDGAVHVTSDENITVSAINFLSDSGDAFLVLPVAALGTEYIMASYELPSSNKGARMTVVATQDNTLVTFNGTTDLFLVDDIPVQVAGQDYTVSINQGDVFRIQSFNSQRGDYTGSSIISDKPIAVLGEENCAVIPLGTPGCSHSLEQLLSIDSFGDEYYLAPLANRVGYTTRVVAAFDDTDVFINGAFVDQLEKGRYYESILFDAAQVTSSQPTLVMQYAHGYAYDLGSRPISTPEVGADAFMAIATAPGQFLKKYRLSIPDSGYALHFLNVVVQTSDIADIDLDGVLVSSAEFSQVGNSDFSYVQLEVSSGDHTLQSTAEFGLHAYGWGASDSYGFLAGTAVSPSEEVFSIELDSAGTGTVGGTVCSTARVLNLAGIPIWGVQAHFSVDGERILSDFKHTDFNGEASYCYQGLALGNETLMVEASGITNSIDIEWIADSSGVNQGPVVTSLPTVALNSGELFDYQINAIDPEGDLLSYALLDGPSGMTVDVNGRMNWIASSLTDDIPVVVQVADGFGGEVLHSFLLREFVEFNLPPSFTFEPYLIGKQNAQYFYHPPEVPSRFRTIVFTDDPDDGSALVSIVTAPPGVVITDNRISWTPSEPGLHEFVLESRDARGKFVLEEFVVDVEADFPPVVTSTPTTSANVNTLYEYIPRATDDLIPDSFLQSNYVLEQAPVGMVRDTTFDTDGSTVSKLLWTPNSSQVGTHVVRLKFEDLINVVIQEFTIVVSDSVPPSIDSTPVLTAGVEVPYSYQLQVSGAVGALFTYTLEAAPAGMSVDAAGLIVWLPSTAQLGVFPVEILVEDDNGGIIRQQYDVTVGQGANTAPTIDSTPATNGVVDIAYQYAVTATDAEGHAITYTLETAPVGMNIDEVTGQITWLPTSTQVGSNAVEVRASDFGMFQEQSFSIEVTSDPLPLVASIDVSPSVIGIGESVSVTVNVSGGLAPASIAFTVDGNPVTLDGNNQAVIVGNTLGVFNLQATVSDGDDTVIADAFFTVNDPSDVTAPVVTLSSPVEGESITSIVDIIGSVTEDNLAEYFVAISPARKAQFTVLASGSTEQSNEILAQFDPTLLVNGQYDILLQATDFNGQTGTASATVLVEGDLKVGNFSFTLLDLEIPVAGIPIRVTRTYDSRRRNELLDFGYGWSVGYQDLKVEESRTLGAGWELIQFQSGPLNAITTFCVQPLGDPTVTVTLPSGDVEKFTAKAVPECNDFLPILQVDLAFEPVGDTQSELRLPAPITLALQEDRLEFLGSGIPFDPDNYVLTTRSGLAYSLDQDFGVNRIDEPNGNFLTFDQLGIVHSSGKSVDFTRDGQGKITSITDPAGEVINYFYDASNDLVEAQDQVSTEANLSGSTYTYNNNHGLVDMFDPLGRRLVKNIYDDDGRLIAQEDQNGVRTEFNHDLAGQQSIVTDRNNNTTVFFYDDRGNVTSQVDALNGITSFSYDANDNQLTQTDPLNNSSSASYNSSNDQLTQTDALNNTVEFTYNDRGDELTIIDARNNVFTNTYDSFGNLLTVSDPLSNVAGNNINAQGLVSLTQDVLGNTTSFSYDSSGNKLTETDAELNTTTFTYDDNGNVLTESRERTVGGSTVTETTTFEYDAMNRVTRTIDALNRVTDTFYDGAGNQIAVLDPLGRLTEFEYDAYGRLTKTLYPDLSEELKTYDPEGNLLTDTDRLGRVTSFEYDKLNRLVKTTFDDLSFTETEYDAAGRVTAEIDARGNRSEFGYDAAGRRTSSTDALLKVTSFVYDEDGNLTSQTDANNHTMTFVYNALDQRTQTVFHDGTTVDEEFDALGRLISKTDQANVTTDYEYDALGRLTAVMDALNQRTEFEYDEAGNKLLQRDAKLNETSWTYDALGRVLTRTLPLGQVESFTYDANGNPLTRTDFNGDTTSFEYDNNDRLVKTTYQDLSEETFTYDAVGNRLGEYYLRARYYDQSVGRFTQMDSFQGIDNEPVTLHKYLYGNVDPVNVIDPSGNFGLTEVSITQNIVSTLNMLQVDNAFNILDTLGVSDADIDAARVVNSAIGIVALGSAGIKISRILSKKSRGLDGGRKIFKTGDKDPAADSLASRIGGQSSVRLEGLGNREFDVISDKFVAQTFGGTSFSVNPKNFLSKSRRNQIRATLSAAGQTNREAFFEFQNGMRPANSVVDFIIRNAKSFGVEVSIVF